MKIFLVISNSGEVDDYSEWPVKAFLSESKAKGFIQAANTEATRISKEVEEVELEFSKKSKPYKDELSKLSRGYFILQESNRKDLEMAKRSRKIKRKMGSLIDKIGRQYSKLSTEIEKIRKSSKNYPDVEGTCYSLQELELMEE